MVYLKQNPYFVPFPSFYGMLDLVFRTSDCLSYPRDSSGILPYQRQPGRPAGTVTQTLNSRQIEAKAEISVHKFHAESRLIPMDVIKISKFRYKILMESRAVDFNL